VRKGRHRLLEVREEWPRRSDRKGTLLLPYFECDVTKPGGCADFAARITPTSRAIARRCRVIRVVTNELASTRLDGPPLSSSQRDFVRSAAARCSRSSRGNHDAVRGQLVGCVWLDEACEARSSSPETNFCRYARNMS